MADTPATLAAASSYLNTGDLSAGYTTIVDWRSATFTDADTAATYVWVGGGTKGVASILGQFYLDPADFTVAGIAPKYLLRATCLTNTVASTITYTAGLHTVTAVAGAADVITPTIGAAVSNSTAAFASQSASTRATVTSGDFTAPAAGYFCLGVVSSGTTTTDNRSNLSVTLLRHNVP